MFNVLNDRQAIFLENKAVRLLRAVERARLQFLAKTGTPSDNINTLSRSYLHRLPLELIISVFGYAEWRDVVHLRTVCRRFKDLIDTHEHVIVSTMINLGGSDMSLLSQLFPPARSRRPSHGGARRPTLQYNYSLENRNTICGELAYYLARRAINPMFNRQNAATPNITRRDKKDLNQRKEQAIRIIQRHLVRQLYHVEHFLVNTRLHLSASLTSLAAENTTDNPPTPALLAQIYQEVQMSIVSAWPDSALVSTHHAFHFLVNTIRLAISPEPPHNTNDETVSTMLRCPYPLQRCNEFFAADTPSAPNRLRRQFMMDMQEEKEKAGLLANVVFGGGERKVGKRRGSMPCKDPSWVPRMGEVWFEAARSELRRRGLEKHSPDGVFFFPEVQGEVMVGCPDCQIK